MDMRHQIKRRIELATFDKPVVQKYAVAWYKAAKEADKALEAEEFQKLRKRKPDKQKR